MNDKIYNITSDSIFAYLILTGWEHEENFINKNLNVFINKEQDIKIAIPANEKYNDFYSILDKILVTLSNIENREINIILKDISNIYTDHMEFRIISDMTKKFKLPLPYAHECIKGISELILYAACAEERSIPICRKATVKAKNKLNDFQFAQTEAGSFIINIDVNIFDEEANRQMNCFNKTIYKSYEHEIVKRIGKSLEQVNDIVNKTVSIDDIIENGYIDGITANICDALIKLKPSEHEVEIDTTIRHAPIIHNTINDVSNITINNKHFHIFNEISQRFKEKESTVTVELEGYIKSLSKDEPRNSTQQNAKLFTLYEGNAKLISVDLNDKHYKIACDAHRDELKVRTAGILDMSNRNWKMYDVEYFYIDS